MNELLEQATTEAGNLADQADTASDSIETLLTKASALKEQVTNRGAEARTLLQDLKAALAEAQSGVEGARGRADSSLAGLGTKATEVRADVTGLLEQVKRSLDELEAQKARLQADADTQAQAVEGALSELAEHASDTGEAINQRLVTAVEAITALRSAVETARTELAAKKTAWDQAAQELEEQATEQSANWVDGVQQILADQATAMVEMTNGVVEAHNAAMEDLKEKFALEATNRVADSVLALAQELESLGQNATGEQDTLTQRSDAILGRIRAAVPVIEQLGTALDAAAGRV
jgi:ABC-type transporter Mla subunit MlaD